MFLLSLVVVGLTVVGLFLLVRAAFSAPEGAEDEHGFHLASNERKSEEAVPVLVSATDLAFFRR